MNQWIYPLSDENPKKLTIPDGANQWIYPLFGENLKKMTNLGGAYFWIALFDENAAGIPEQLPNIYLPYKPSFADE